MAWYLQIAAGAPRTFTSLGAVNLKRALKSAAESTFTFEVPSTGMDANALAGEGTLCTVLSGTPGNFTPFFSGRIYQVPRTGEPGAETVKYEIRDAWEDFRRNIFQQQWTYGSGVEDGVPTTAPDYSSRVILGMGVQVVDGSNVFVAYNSGQVIAEIVNWLLNPGGTGNSLANCQIGNINVDAPVPLMEVRDQTCAEAIKKLLRLTPDAVAWFDYTQTPPAFNVTRRANCAAVAQVFAGVPEKQDIRARPDLLAQSVVIHYEIEGNLGGSPFVETDFDVAPDGATGLEYGAIVATIKLSGSSSTFQKQPVKGSPIPPEDCTEAVELAWFQRYVAGLAQFSTDRLSVDLDTDLITVVPDAGPNTGAPNVNTNPDAYPNGLEHGNIPDWVKTAYGIITAQVTLGATVTYTPSGGNDAQDKAALQYFGPGFSMWKSHRVTGTNATNMTYEQLSGFVAGEPVPAGLAAQLYAAVSQLQYEGSYTLVNCEVPPASALGIVLNLTGSNQADWAAMNALVQEIEDELDTGKTTFKFGPAEHLTIQDLIEQVRALRVKLSTGAIQQRLNGTPSDSASVDGSGTNPVHDTDTGGGGDSYPWIDYADDPDDSDPDGADEVYNVLCGYGASDFAGDPIGNASPISKFELDVGNTTSEWPDNVGIDQGSLYNALSLISGDGTASIDALLFGRSDADGNGGALLVTPFDPSLVLSPNLDGSYTPGSDQFIELSLSDMIIQIQDESSALISLDLSDGPILNLDDGSGSVITLDLTSEPDVYLQDDDGDEIELDLIDGAPIITVTASGGSSSSLDSNSVNLYDADSGTTISADAGASDITISDGSGDIVTINQSEISISDSAGSSTFSSSSISASDDSDGGSFDADASDLAGGDATFQQVSLYGSGGYLNTFYALCTEPVAAGDNNDFADAVKAVIAGLSWTAVCNDSGGINITADD